MLDLPRVFITQKGEKHAKTGHPWVFEGEVIKILPSPSRADISDLSDDDMPVDGRLVNVFSRSEDKPCYIGTGFYNSKSKIRVRLISTNANDRFDEAFWRRRLKYALDYRKTVMGEDFHSCRLIFGEADQFPGLTVDLFEDVLVCQVLSLGIEKIKGTLFSHLVELLDDYGVKVRAVYERNDVNLREKEGMAEFKGYFMGGENSDGTVRITENGIKYDVDYVNGQKTGFFLDQKYNRLSAARLAGGKNVLDCFTHTGAFALNCAASGAAHVTAVDISSSAIEQTKHNAEINNLCRNMDFLCADVFELLTEIVKKKEQRYDYIILDPPAFTKSSSTVKDAFRGYKDINYRAMRALPRGGYLATCSCSHFMKAELFCKMLHEAASDAGVSLRQIEARTQSPDHPILWNVDETDYLKFYLFQVV
ncbi:MAG: class I SAM-dependent rRNA methyltransferase [Eubacteriales bacterium]